MLETITSRPGRGLFALLAAQVIFWTLAPALSHSAPPLDVVEMYAWGREGVVATFKHPNLPGLVLEFIRALTGQAGWPAYLVSQIFVAVTFWTVYELGKEILDPQRALAGVLLLTGVYFFSWPTPEFNHNVAQMPLWALITLTLWRATTRGHWLSWLALGVFGGLSLWAKYSSGVLLVIAAVWVLWDPTARRRILTPGPWVALAAFLAIAAPQALWLVEHDFSPFAYAARRASAGAWYAPIEFLLTLLIDHLPMAILLLAAGYFGKSQTEASTPPERRVLRYLLLMGAGPAALMALGAALTGASLRASWGAPMLSFSGLIVVTVMTRKFSHARLQRMAAGAGILIALTSGLYFAHMRYGAVFTSKPLRGNWPQAEISRALDAQWMQATQRPLRIVAGDIWTAGLVNMSNREPPSVLINGDLSISPWVSPEGLEADGALIVWRGDEAPPGALEGLARGLETHTLTIPYARFPEAPPLVLHYAILAPNDSADLSD